MTGRGPKLQHWPLLDRRQDVCVCVWGGDRQCHRPVRRTQKSIDSESNLNSSGKEDPESLRECHRPSQIDVIIFYHVCSINMGDNQRRARATTLIFS